MMRGDEYRIPVEIKTELGLADDTTFADVEIVIGNLHKRMSSGEVEYDPLEKAFMVKVTQAETFGLTPGLKSAQVRVKTFGGDVIGTQMPGLNLLSSLSEEVL